MPDLYFNRVPSLPATDDGSARPLTEDLSTGSGDGEDITWDADSAEAGEVPAAAGAASGTRPAGAEPRDGEADAGPEPRRCAESRTAGPGMAGPDGEAEFTEDDVAFLSAPQEADAAVAANGTVTEGAPGPDAAPAIGESGRWFRPAKAKKKYVPIPPEDQDDSAGLDAAPADPEPDGAEATQEPAGTGRRRGNAGAPGTGRGARGEHAIRPGEDAEAEAEPRRARTGDGDAAPADWASQEQPEWVSPQEARPAEVWTPPYQAAGPPGCGARLRGGSGRRLRGG